MKIKKTVKGVEHTAKYTYSGLTEETAKRFNKLYAEAVRVGKKK